MAGEATALACPFHTDSADAYYNRGNAKRNLGRHEDALADHDEAIRSEPDSADAYYNRGRVRFTLGHKDEARQDFETALALARPAGNGTMADRANRAIEQPSGDGDP